MSWRVNPVGVSRAIGESRGGFLEGYPDLLNVEHMREITGLAASTIRSECAKGRIPAVRIGRRWFVPKAHFAEHVGVAYVR